MNNKLDISKILKDLKKPRLSYKRHAINPTRDWLFGLALFAALVVGGSLYSAYSFIQYQTLVPEGGEVTDKVVRYNKPVIDKVIELYTKRKNNFNDTEVFVPEVATTTTESATTTDEIEGGDGGATLEEEVMIVN